MSFPPLPEAACRGPPEYAGNGARDALMALPEDRIGKAVGRALRDPGRMAREAWSRKIEAAFLLAALVPSPLRSLIGRPLAYVAGRLAARSSRPDTSPQVAYAALWVTGRVHARQLAGALVSRDWAAARRLGLWPLAALGARLSRCAATFHAWAQAAEAGTS